LKWDNSILCNCPKTLNMMSNSSGLSNLCLEKNRNYFKWVFNLNKEEKGTFDKLLDVKFIILLEKDWKRYCRKLLLW
jgi:hypothetical protein